MLSIEKRITALIRKLQKNKVFQSRWYKALTALAIVVVFCTTYALILPAVTLTGDPNCGEEEHTHTDACIGEVLICGYDDAGAPQAMALSAAHTDPFEPICGKEEHIHTDECYELQKVKVCLDEDPTHQHNEFCFAEELVLTCRQKEHVHGPECFPAPEEPDEQEPHVHTDACYAEEYICGQTEHTHTDACYAEPDETEDTSEAAAATEDEEDANSTIAKPWEIALSLTGDTKADIVRVAESQLGYKESTEDYIEDTLSGSAQGYTIYGDWYGEPYGEWSAIFAAYCLNQAGVDEFDFPYESDPLFWMEDLRSAGLLKNLRYTPEEGDLVFLDTDTDGMADKVGIINEIDAWSELFTCVVGDSDNRVEEQEYFTMDFEVLAYAAVRGDEFAMPDIDADMKPGNLDDMDSADVELELDSIFDAIPELPEDVAASEAFDEMYGELPAASELADGEPDASSTLPEMSAPARPLSTEVFTYKDEDVRIAVTLPAGAAVPADATLEVTPVTAFDADYGMIQSLAQEALDDSLAQEYLAELEAWGLLTDSVDQNAGKAIIGDLTYYNVYFTTADGDTLPLEEGAQVTVRFADGILPVAVDTADYSVLVYSDDGSTAAAPETLATEWTSSAIRFTAANSISGFAVVSSEEYNTASIRGVTADDGSARVVVELPDGSSVPQAASLSVTRVLPGEPAYDYYRLLDQANEKLAGIEDVVLYDISFTLDDMTYDVPDTAQVSIRLLDDSLLLESEQEAAVLRYGHSSELPGIVSARAYLDAGSPVIAFETEGFAVFGIAKVSESDLGGTYAIIAQTEADPDALAEDAEPYNYYALTANEQTVGIVTGLQGAEVTMNDSGEPVAAQNAGVAFWKLEKVQEAENGSAAYTVQEAESGAYLNMDAAGALTLTTEPQEFTLAQSGDGTITLTTEDATLALLETEDEGENLFAADSTDSATFGTPVTALSLYDTLLVSDENVLDAYNTEPVTLTSEDEDAGYIVTVTYDADANLPEGTTLSVSEYDQDSDTYAARYAEAAALYGWDAESEDEDEDTEENTLVEVVSEDAEDDTAEETGEETTVTTHSVRLFDITLYDADGTEVEPEAPVTVAITLANVSEEITDYTIIHFVDDYAENAGVMLLALDDEPETAGTIEEMEPEAEYDAAAMTQTFSFETDAFTDYGISLTAGPSPGGGGPGGNPGDNQGELDPSNYNSSAYVYWDTMSAGGSSTSGYYGLNSSTGITSVYLGTSESTTSSVVKGNSTARSWSGGTQLSTYFPNAKKSESSSDESTMQDGVLIITPADGYYVTKVVVACCATSEDPFQCKTWGEGNAFTANFSVGTSGTVKIDVSSLDFSHSSGDDNYFILIEVAPIPSPLYVEYDYGDIVDIIENSSYTDIDTAFSTADGWTTGNTGNVYGDGYGDSNGDGNPGVKTAYTQYKYAYQGEDNAEQAAAWKHYANTITTSAKEQAAAAGYYFAGWKAEYYTSVDVSGTSDTSNAYTNNYTYSFDSESAYGTNYYGEDDEVELTTNVRLIAQWEPVKITVSKTVTGLTDNSEFDTTHTYTLKVEYSSNGGTDWSEYAIVNLTVDGNNTESTAISPVVPGLYRVTETDGNGNLTGESTTMYISVSESGNVTVTKDDIISAGSNAVANSTDCIVGTLSVTNSYSEQPNTTSVTIKKVDAGDGEGYTTGLSGAEFVLYKLDGDTRQYYTSTTTTDSDGNVTTKVTWEDDADNADTFTSGENGLITIDSLQNGTYYLEETQAPDGYNLLTEAIGFTVSGSSISLDEGTDSNVADVANGTDADGNTTYTLVVKNTAGNALPSTGGRGTRGYTIAGMILICSAAYVLYRTMRKRKEGV